MPSNQDYIYWQLVTIWIFQESYPAIYKHLETIGEQIELGENNSERVREYSIETTKVKNWWNLRACAYYSQFDEEKIVYPETTHSANFFYDSGEFFLDKTCFMITGSDLKILGGITKLYIDNFCL